MSNRNKFHINWEFSRLELAIAAVSVTVISFCLFYILFAFTPLHNAIPGYPTASVRRQQMETAIRVDSLERCIRRWELYSENLRTVIAGGQPVSIESIIRQVKSDSTAKDARTLAKSDSTIRAAIIEEEKFEISDKNKRNLQIEGIHFFKPMAGTVSTAFDNALHPYIDITAPEGSPVKSVLDGYVIYTEWNEIYGWSIIIQHDNNIVSIYRHNQKLLKNAADFVHAGSNIGLLGSSSLSQGSHLQFELWQEGRPVDPAIYINF